MTESGVCGQNEGGIAFDVAAVSQLGKMAKTMLAIIMVAICQMASVIISNFSRSDYRSKIHECVKARVKIALNYNQRTYMRWHFAIGLALGLFQRIG